MQVSLSGQTALLCSAEWTLTFPQLQRNPFRGPWGRCMGAECGPGGSQSRAVWCAHADGWTTLHSNCPPATQPENQRACFHVCDWHRQLYDWHLGPWGRCVPVHQRGAPLPTWAPSCTRGEEGIQIREVRCVRTADGGLAEEDAICEYFEPKPRLEQGCLVPCPRDCVVSGFTPWSPCSAPCGGVGLQSRARSVLAPPLFDGGDCPALAEFRPCEGGACRGGEGRGEGGVGLRVGPWSPCSPPSPPRLARQARRRKNKERSREKGGARDPETRELIKKKRTRNRQNRPDSKLWDLQVGHQIREVTCIHRNATPASLSEWGELSACSKSCYDLNGPQGERSRTRRVRRFPVGGGAECPPLEEAEPCAPQGEGVPPCTVYTWRTSEWSECRIDMLLSQQDRRRSNLTGLCGGGVQSREVYCVQGNGDSASYLTMPRDKEASRPVSRLLCLGPVPNTTQLCHTPCPVQCALSPWSAWGPCTFENCMDQAGKKGFKLRKRTVLNDPTGGAGNCPHLVEAIPCDEPSCYDWLVVRLEECAPVDRQLCRDAILPIPVACDVPCPKDCTLSPWTPCQCPNSSALQESRSCNAHPCTVYHWQASAWGHCIEDTSIASLNSSSPASARGGALGLGGATACSVGMQTRKVICVRDNVGQVPPKKCPESLRPETVRPCLLPCKRDCVVTPYSEWTPCPSTCQTGSSTKRKQSRKRIITQLPANGGQECPEVEDAQVAQMPVGAMGGSAGQPWGPGELWARLADQGKQDGGVADIAECLKLGVPMPPVTQLCQLPCQDDCQLTAWSRFTSCSSDCAGFRTRKRAL
ncbi:hypothetical protein JZ751_009127, partial [Albula glossodonta]